MAKRSNDELLIKLGLQGQAEWDAFLKQLKSISKEVNKITAGVKQLENIGKAGTFAEVMGTPGGKERFIAGGQFQGRRRARATMELGTGGGQNLQNLKDELSLRNAIERVMSKENALAQAKNVSLSTTAAEIRKITDLSKVSEQIEAVRVRRAQEWYAGNKDNVAILRNQLDLLKQQESALKAKPVMSPAEKQAMDRQRNMSRLFGDGGAGLLTIQAGLMTNYAALNAATSGIGASINFAIELDAALRNLQAITVTTDGNMGALKETIISVSEQTKFSAVEVANAAIILGQAGMSVKQIESSIGAVSLLATATGTDLTKAVDIATSTLDVFNMEASQMGHVADVLTSAVNQSKLDIEKLTLGLQYAGNTAAQSGVTFEELTAALGAMSNAGIRSGSTLGTGMRQILISLEKPSTAFLETLARLGLTMEDVNVRSNGIYGAFKNLRDAGFTAADAIQSFEIRGAAAFTALSGNLDSMLQMEEGFVNSTAAIRANETQMRSFKNTLQNFTGVLLSVVETGIQPFLLAGRDVLAWMTDWLEQVRIAKPLIQLLTGSVVALAGAFAIMYPLRLAVGLAKMVKEMGAARLAAKAAAAEATAVAVANTAMGASTVAAAATGGRFATALGAMTNGTTVLSAALGLLGKAFRLMTGPWGLLITAVGLGITGLMAYRSETEKTRRSIDELRTDFDNANGSMQEQGSQIEMVTGEIQHLNDRYNVLTEDSGLLATEVSKVREQFAEMGIDVNKPLTTVDALLEELKLLRTELSEEYVIRLRTVVDKIDDLVEGQGQQLEQSRGRITDATTTFNEGIFKQNRLYSQNPLTMDNALLDMLAVLQDPETDSAQLTRIQRDLGLKFEANQPIALNSSDGRAKNYAQLENAFIATLLPIIEEMLPRVRELASAEAEKIRLDRQVMLEDQKMRPGFQAISGTLDGMQASTSAVLDARVSGVKPEDVSGRGKAAEAAVAEGQARLQELAREINQYADATGMDDELRQKLLARVNEMDMGLITRAEPYITAGRSESENLRQGELSRISDELQAARDRLQSQDTDNFVEVTNIGREITDLYLERFQNQIDSINAGDGTFNEKKQAREGVQRELDAALSELRAQMGEKNNGFDVQALESRIAGSNLLIDDMQASMSKETDPAVIEQMAKDIAALITSRGEMQSELGGLNSEEPIFFAQLSAALETEIAAVNQSASDRKKEILDASVEALKKQITDLQSAADMEDDRLSAQIDAAATPAEVTRLSAQRIAAKVRFRDAFLRLVAQIEDTGVDFDDMDMQEMLFAITEAISAINEDANARREDLASLAADEAEKVRSDRLEQLQADEEAKEAAYKNAKDLYKEAYGQADRAAKMKAAMDALSAYLAAAVARIQAEFADSPAGVLDSMLSAFNFDVAIPETREINSPDFGAGGGGGGGGKKKSAIETAADQLDARVKAYESMLEAKLITGTSGIAKVDTLVGDIQAKIGEIDGQISAMQSKVDGGQMSEEDLEQLNMLLAARKQLTDAATQAEKMLTDEMIRQGDYWGATKNIAVNWAKENLDTVDAFTKGIENVLSTMTSGFATLFTDLANGTKSAKDAFRDFALSVVKSIQSMIAEMLAMYLMQQLIGMVFPGEQAKGSLGAFLKSWAGMAGGGEVKRMAGGGVARDSVPAMLMPGEYVMRKTAVDMIGVDNLDAMNARGNAVISNSGHKGVAKPKDKAPAFTNVYVVSPDQQPVPGPSDIIAVINDDIARGGSTKRLIKTVAMGF